jgi:hypothetical protein
MVAREEFQKGILWYILYNPKLLALRNILGVILLENSQLMASWKVFQYRIPEICSINTRRYSSIGSQKYVPSMAIRNIFQELFSRNVCSHWLPRIHSNNCTQEFIPGIARPEYIPILAHLDVGSQLNTPLMATRNILQEWPPGIYLVLGPRYTINIMIPKSIFHELIPWDIFQE